MPNLAGAPELDQLPLNLDGTNNAGNKTLGAPHIRKLAPDTMREGPTGISAKRRPEHLPHMAGLTGIERLKHFADWASKQQEGQAIVIAGHSLWFKSFFQLYSSLPFEERTTAWHSMA